MNHGIDYVAFELRYDAEDGDYLYDRLLSYDCILDNLQDSELPAALAVAHWDNGLREGTFQNVDNAACEILDCWPAGVYDVGNIKRASDILERRLQGLPQHEPLDAAPWRIVGF